MNEQVTGGTTSGEPTTTTVAPVADGSPNLADEVFNEIKGKEVAPPPSEPTKTQLSEDVLKQLEAMSPEELPQAWREKLEKPFLSQYGKKTTAWDNERQSYLTLIDNLSKKLETTNAVPADTRSRVGELLAAGDYDAAASLIRDEIKSEITPERQFVSTMVALNEAKSLMPELPKYEEMVAVALKQDPVLHEMSQVANRKYAGRVIAGLAFQAENIQLRKSLQEIEKNFEARVKMAVDETQRRLRGMPPSTSRAGSAPSAEPANKPMTLHEAMEAAWTEQGGA